MAGHRGIEPLLLDLESNVLPLTLMTCVAPRAGLEPATRWLTVTHSTNWVIGDCGGADKNRTCYLFRAREALSQMSYSPMADVVGFEPTLTGLESVVLPLTLYAYTWGSVWPWRSSIFILSVWHLLCWIFFFGQIKAYAIVVSDITATMIIAINIIMNIIFLVHIKI